MSFPNGRGFGPSERLPGNSKQGWTGLETRPTASLDLADDQAGVVAAESEAV